MFPCHSPLTNQLPANTHSTSAPLEAVQCTTALPSSQEAKRAADTNLASAEPHDQVSNEGVFCLSRAVAHHHTPAIGLGQLAAARDQEKQLTPCPVPSSLSSSDTAKGSTGLALVQARITAQGDQELLSQTLSPWEVVQGTHVT